MIFNNLFQIIVIVKKQLTILDQIAYIILYVIFFLNRPNGLQKIQQKNLIFSGEIFI
jgi:hypothetical protein